MIKLFQRTRQRFLTENKTGKYFNYAIGEIGVLIALQINNWNENKKVESIKKDYLQSFLEDLKVGFLNIMNHIDFAKDRISEQTKHKLAIPSIPQARRLCNRMLVKN